MHKSVPLFLAALLMMSTTPIQAVDTPNSLSVWFGTRGSHIYRADFNVSSGELANAEVAGDVQSPGFVTVNRAGTRLYSLGVAPGNSGNVSVFSVDPQTQTLSLLATADSGGGKGTHLSLSHDEHTLLLAHYGGGCISTFPVQADGTLAAAASLIHHQGNSVNPERQNKPHPHWIGPTPDDNFVLVPDLGMDQVVIYRRDKTSGRLEPHGAGQVPPGAGPRNLKFHPNGQWVYVINELDLTVTGFRYDSVPGSLEPIGSTPAMTLSTAKTPTSGSEIRMHPSGQFLYAGLRGEDVIAVFRIDTSDGSLQLVEREPVRGSWPRNFGLDPSGQWLLAAGAESDTISVFRIDQQTGKLFFTRKSIHVPQCICVEFLTRP